MSRWIKVTKHEPCPVCHKPDWCAWSPDREILRCMRHGEVPVGMHCQGADKSGGTLYVSKNGRVSSTHKSTSKHVSSRPGIDWRTYMNRLRSKITVEQLNALADLTGIPVRGLAKLNPGWADADDLRTMRAGGARWSDSYPNGAWVFEEHRGDGCSVGVSLRTEDGRKGSPSGSTGACRGIVLPTTLHDLPDPVLIVEGASDVAACSALGLAAVGRPSNRAGAADLAVMLDGREVLVIGERDGKPDGSWPGRDGAKAIAEQLAGRWGEPIGWTLPPIDAKDIRVWLQEHAASGLNTSDEAVMQAAGQRLLAELKRSVKTIRPARRSQADALADLALVRFRLGVTDQRDAFAVANDGPSEALMFRGGKHSLRAMLARMFWQETGKTPSASALVDAMTALEGQANESPAEPVALRLAELPSDMSDIADKQTASPSNGLVLDLAQKSGRFVILHPDRWELSDKSPVLFHRTALTGTLPEPADESDPSALLELRELLNVSDDTWPLVVGWLVGCFFPEIPHPVMMVGGEQGTGKSTATRMLVNLVDPSPALLRSQPRDAEQWAITAAGSWCVAVDNVSHIAGWWSDALCKAVTGDGWIRRKLYTDSDLSLLTFRRCILLTSIDAGALRGDLGDRLVLIDLERIAEDHRRTESELDSTYSAAWPRLLSGLLTAVARTLATLSDVKLDCLPRMADFARVLAALDCACPELTGGQAFDLFVGQRERIAGDVVDADPVAVAVLELLDEHSEWSGTAAELLVALTPTDEQYKARRPKQWPVTAQGMGGAIKRVTPALRSVGVEVKYDRDTSRKRSRRWTLRKLTHSNVQHVRTSADGLSKTLEASSERTCDTTGSSGNVHIPPDYSRPDESESQISDMSDMSDDLFPVTSDVDDDEWVTI